MLYATYKTILGTEYLLSILRRQDIMFFAMDNQNGL